MRLDAFYEAVVEMSEEPAMSVDKLEGLVRLTSRLGLTAAQLRELQAATGACDALVLRARAASADGAAEDGGTDAAVAGRLDSARAALLGESE